MWSLPDRGVGKSFPASHRPPERVCILLGMLAFRSFKLEVIRQPIKIRSSYWEDIAIIRMRANIAKPKRLRVLELRTKSIQPNLATRRWRVEVHQQRNQLCHARVLGGRLARKPVKNVPASF